jgi:hypothetical protein
MMMHKNGRAGLGALVVALSTVLLATPARAGKPPPISEGPLQSVVNTLLPENAQMWLLRKGNFEKVSAVGLAPAAGLCTMSGACLLGAGAVALIGTAACGGAIAPEVMDDASEKLRFQSCYPSLQPSITEKELATLFTAWKRDPLLRMRSPEVHCLHRATVLAQKLTELGYKARFLHIKASPVLIGMNRDAQGQPASYEEYHGEHWVISVDVAGADGKVVPKILDPQFRESPADYSDYFIHSTGQECKTDPATYWACDFATQEITSFATQPFSAAQPKLTDSAGCQWPLAKLAAQEIDAVNQAKYSGSIPIPADLKGDPFVASKLIVQDYGVAQAKLMADITLAQLAIKNITDTPDVFLNGVKGKMLYVMLDRQFTPEAEVEALIQSRKHELARLQGLLDQYPGKLAEIKANLGL